ncbi:MAG: DUF1150 family protein [Pseudorhodoplanes sp.]|uniref:DUF1150 family protein n=1 Tax=Pseudorhodoplanes sp. TaxID=1934341 RepID=UPI003D0DFC9C
MSASASRTIAAASMSARDLATLAWRNLAYVRVARSEDVGFFCPEAPLLAPGRDVFVLYAADGTPILVTDSREAAVANAEREELEAVSVH